MLTNWITGRLHWFDILSGEGIIKDDAGRAYFVAKPALTAEVLNATSEAPTLPIRFKLIVDTTFAQVTQVKLDDEQPMSDPECQRLITADEGYYPDTFDTKLDNLLRATFKK